jgi:hypothetical protein
MTERRARRRTPGALNAGLLTLAAFFAALALLGTQLRGGAARKPPRPVLVRKIYKTTIDERVIGASRGSSSSSSESQTLGSEGAQAPLVATRTS